MRRSRERPGEPRPTSGELRVESVDVAFEARKVLDHVTLETGPGSLVGLLGPNGSGKTTLLRTINGFLRPQGGAVWLDGRDLQSLKTTAIARAVARIPQNTNLEYSFTARETVLMGRHPHLGRFALEGTRDVQIAEDALATVGLRGMEGRSVDTVSGGERQLVLVARALAQQSRVLLLDEPTASLDIAHQVQVMELVGALVRQGVTAVAALHDLSLAAAYCTHLVLLSQGRVVATGRPAEVLTPRNLREVFSVWATVHPDAVTGRLIVTPSRALSPSPRPGVVHVIVGGGAGASLMVELVRAGHRVTSGVLNEGDTDLATARSLGLETVAAPPFAAIDEANHAKNLALIAQADVVVLAETPVGHANFRNLEAAGAARSLVAVRDTPFADRDFTGGQATALWERMSGRAVLVRREDVLTAVDRLLAKAPVAAE